MSHLEYCLGKNCGVTFAGLKIASLFRLRKIHADELGYFADCFAKKGFKFEILRDDGEWLLLYVYHEERLKARLFEEASYRFLCGRGYDFSCVADAIAQLKEALRSGEFPHEIGVFLGYHLDDVKSFILSPDRGVVLTGCWKVYHDPEEKAKLFERFERCSNRICALLQGGTPLTQIFNVV